ncbi:MAG TPA: hypothetical protein ENI96_00305 [Sedimenticola thiotaurini]|uniref:Thioredoxin domain-containing protein n=1 Tax=Sedimenticola thiotaurini TaxID=1543721 RepID=A0A831RGP5_9GAMM|nr:hypothetical protein [Sedimenticola thiotaurini]
MSWFGVVILTLVGLMILFQASIYWRSKRMVGREAPDLGDEAGARAGGSRLIYFHSPNCGPCKRMSPMIEEMARRHPNIQSIDVSRQMELALKYNVRATPTVVLVKEGKVAKVLLGPQSQARLEALVKEG